MSGSAASRVSRRSFLGCVGAAAAAPVLADSQPREAPSGEDSRNRVRFCLNTSTVRGQNLSLAEQIDLAGRTGYDGIEPWIRDVRAAVEAGESLSDLRKRIDDYGLKVESAIGFANWIVDDDDARQRGLEEMRSDMELLAQLGGTRIAAPPVGMHRPDAAALDLDVAAERYHAVLELGRQTGVVPQLEIWGPSRNLSRLCESVYVAIASGHEDACLLPDVYHLFRGGSDFDGLKLVAGSAIHVFHMNDYPAQPPRLEMTDADRVYPGDGVAPLKQILETLLGNGFSGALSLELFNRDYWAMDATTVAETGLSKMKAALP